MEPLTPNHIADIWKRGAVDLTSGEKRGMILMASALAVATRNDPKVFKCPDGTLLKIDKYDPNAFSELNVARKMNDPFIQAAINQAYENGYRVGRAH